VRFSWYVYHEISYHMHHKHWKILAPMFPGITLER
jgi:hypothetical protein